MRTSNNGIQLIKSFEGCRLDAYKDVGGTLTIGYGHTAGVTAGQHITQEQADSLLAEDLVKYENKVNKYANVYNFNQNQFDALVSFCYNIGNIDGLTNNGTIPLEQISVDMTKYVYAGGKVINGLVNRRNKEKELFNTPTATSTTTVKSNEEIANEVIAGKWGNGTDRQSRLTSAGYDYNAIQSIVNSKLTGSSKSIEEIAKEVIAGDWGNGNDRKTKLTNAGYNYNDVQKMVNKILMR